ncbi:MAG: DUF362 domain-containing protein [Verrucomicrobia bacterium]|nr:DUF362 domain-containing protein [Verrucomicrobiota bacterium]
MRRWPSMPLASLAAAVAVTATAGLAQQVTPREEPGATRKGPLSRVVIARDPQAVRFYDPQPDRVRRLVERGILELTQTTTLAAAWGKFVRPADIVAIKINAAAGPTLSTRRPVVDAVVAGLRAAGVPAHHIIIWDRSADNLVLAGWDIRRDGEGPLCYATLPHAGWDPATYYQTPHVGMLIWGDHEFGARQLSERSYYSRIVSQTATKLINIPVLMDNRHVGLSGCLHNIAIGSVDNNRRFQTEALHYDPGIAELCARPPISGKLVLNILDALVAQCAGAPSFQPEAAWSPGEIYLSRDPVALDALGLQAIEQRRKDTGMRPIGERARHVQIAAEIKAGVADRAKMDIVELKP